MCIVITVGMFPVNTYDQASLCLTDVNHLEMGFVHMCPTLGCVAEVCSAMFSNSVLYILATGADSCNPVDNPHIC